MRTGRLIPYLVVATIVAVSLLTVPILYSLFPNWESANEPLHSSTEALGALASISMAFFLLIREGEEADGKRLMLALGFLGMGLLDGFHSFSSSGSGFVFLRSSASLAGGIFFALTWVDKYERLERNRIWLVTAVAVTAVVLGLWALLFGESLPAMERGGEFTATVRAVNLATGALFIAASVRLLQDYRHTGIMEYFTFSCLALLFGIAGLTFSFSKLWDSVWWFWHFLRVAAYAALLVWIASKHKRAVSTLVSVLEAQRRSQEELRISEKWYREILENVRLIAVILDPQGRVTFCNDYLLSLTGWSRGELLGRDWFKTFIPPQEIDEIKDYFTRIISGNEAVAPRHENTILTRSGKERRISWNNTTLYDNEGKVAGITSIGEDITERKALERQRADFYAMVSHDIKSPLTVVSGYASLLADNIGRFDEDTCSMLTAISNSSMKIEGLLEDFLTISRMEAETLPLRPFPSDISQTLRDACAGFEMAFREKGFVFRIEIEDGLPEKLVMDQKLVQRAVSNLLQNTVNYVPRGGTVTLGAKMCDDRENVIISVTDTGPGIPAEEQGRVFEKYYRSPGTEDVKGTGLGLAIVKAVAEAHGGRVELESEPGKGSTFRMFLPMDIKGEQINAAR